MNPTNLLRHFATRQSSPLPRRRLVRKTAEAKQWRVKKSGSPQSRYKQVLPARPSLRVSTFHSPTPKDRTAARLNRIAQAYKLRHLLSDMALCSTALSVFFIGFHYAIGDPIFDSFSDLNETQEEPHQLPPTTP